MAGDGSWKRPEGRIPCEDIDGCEPEPPVGPEDCVILYE